MAQYLDKFAGTINKTQSEQILTLLSKQRNAGQIRSIKEFTSKLEALMRELTSTVIQPSLKVWAGEAGEDIDEESYNFMLDRVEDDLTTAFLEANNINEVQQSHEAIIRDVILKNLRAGVAELESKVTLFEFLNKDLRGFDSAIFSTFRESKEERTQRENVQAAVLFTDPRNLNVLVPVSQDADVELVGERLILAVSDGTTHNIGAVRQIFDSESPQSEMVVEPPGNNIQNIIDNTSGTYWIQTLLFSRAKKAVKTKLELNLGSVREINYIDVEPASLHGIILESVHYVDGNNVVIDLEIEEKLIESPASFRLKKVATDRVILTFRNESPIRTQFEYNENVQNLYAQATDEPPLGYTPTAERAAKDLNEVIGSEKIKTVVGVPTISYDSFRGYRFTIGIDNIRVGVAEHENRSIYISTPLTMTGTGEVGVKSLETRPYLTPQGELRFTDVTYDLHQQSALDDDDDGTPVAVGEQSRVWFQGSIEYWVIKLDLNADGSLSRITKFPILPLDTERVYHERLVLNEKSVSTLTENDQGTLMFFTTRTDGNIKIYKNGILLEDKTGVPGATTGWQDITTVAQRTPDNGTPMIMKIKILDRLPGDIFTASYTPVTSSTSTIPKTLAEVQQIGGLQVIDLVGDLSARVLPGHLVTLDRVGETGDNTANVYLAIILRQNTADSTLTPAVEEYTLVAGKRDGTKFEEF